MQTCGEHGCSDRVACTCLYGLAVDRERYRRVRRLRLQALELRIPEHEAAFVGLPHGLYYIVEKRRGPLGHDELAALRSHGHVESDHGTEAHIVDAGCEHDL